jgi:hypothetical protein
MFSRSLYLQNTNSLLPFSLSASELGWREKLEAEVGRIADLLIKGLTPGLKRLARRVPR